MLNGNIDHCRGRYIIGWAVPAQPDARCRITVRDPRGGTLAGMIASDCRDDLARIGGGRTDFGFCIGVPPTGAPGPVHVFGNDVELPGSPVMLNPDIFDGEILIDAGVVSGWVCNRQNTRVMQPITLSDQDGRVVLTVPATPVSTDTDPLFSLPGFPPTCLRIALDVRNSV